MASIEVIEYTPDRRDEWDAFVDVSNNGTMFHLQRFLDYHPKGKFSFRHLMFYAEGKLIAVLPGGSFAHSPRSYWSPVGASYGGLVTGDIPYALSLELVDTLIRWGLRQELDEMFVIPPPLIYSRKYNQHVEYSMLYRRFGFEYHYISHAIDLRIGADFLEHFDRTARKTCRKILREKLLRIEESDDYETFYEILLDNKARHNAKPTHSLDDLHELRRLLPGKLRLMLVYYGDIPIAGSLLFMCNSDVVLCFYNMLLYEYQHLKPIYLVMYETVRLAIAEGYRWVDIGVSQIPDSDDPMTPSLPLIDFKERFDARGILRTTYRYDLAARRAEASAT